MFLAALAAFALFAGWIGLSMLWSFGPDLSWMAFDVAALYLAVMAVVGCTPVRRLQLRLAGWGFLVVATAVGVYAFLGKGLPDVVRHAYTYARLDSPIGYWNVLALVMVMGVVVALSFAGDRRCTPSPGPSRRPPPCPWASRSSSPSRAAGGWRWPWRSSSTSL